MNTFYNKHYITIDTQSRITYGWSDGPHHDHDTADAICINGHGSYQFRLFPSGEENPLLYTVDGIPLYCWDGEKVVLRSEEELRLDRALIPAPPPSKEEQLRADIDFLAALQGGDLVSTFEMAQKYYPRLWNKSRLEVLVEAGKLTVEKMKTITNSNALST